jgi:hypothetical protein
VSPPDSCFCEDETARNGERTIDSPSCLTLIQVFDDPERYGASSLFKSLRRTEAYFPWLDGVLPVCTT